MEQILTNLAAINPTHTAAPETLWCPFLRLLKNTPIPLLRISLRRPFLTMSKLHAPLSIPRRSLRTKLQWPRAAIATTTILSSQPQTPWPVWSSLHHPQTRPAALLLAQRDPQAIRPPDGTRTRQDPWWRRRGIKQCYVGCPDCLVHEFWSFAWTQRYSRSFHFLPLVVHHRSWTLLEINRMDEQDRRPRLHHNRSQPVSLSDWSFRAALRILETSRP